MCWGNKTQITGIKKLRFFRTYNNYIKNCTCNNVKSRFCRGSVFEDNRLKDNALKESNVNPSILVELIYSSLLNPNFYYILIWLVVFFFTLISRSLIFIIGFNSLFLVFFLFLYLRLTEFISLSKEDRDLVKEIGRFKFELY